MTRQTGASDDFWPLLNSACDDGLADMETQELATLLEADSIVRKEFIRHIQLRTDVQLLCRARKASDGGLARVRATLLEASPSDSPAAGFLPITLPSAVGYFSSGWPVAYLVATVIFGIGLVIGAMVHVSPVQVVERVSPVMPDKSPHEPEMDLVGRITGMIDCQWAEPDTETINGAHVPLGRRYALSAGLLEITYDTGAKVLLQGPVTYEAESAAGGYLSVGKLTAKLEKKPNLPSPDQPSVGARRRAGGERGRNQNSSDLCPLTSDLFAVRTPTAVVTDLGTEFGVEVDELGATQSHVFRGSVRVQATTRDGKACGDAKVLRENDSARVTRNDKDGAAVVVSSTKAAAFVRNIPKQKIKALDLVDVVAGGDGFSGRRGRGIDPASGRTVSGLRIDGPRVNSDGQYHRVVRMPFVDGVFIPDGRKDRVQVDSAGHVFDGFRGTGNVTLEHIWAGGAMPDPFNQHLTSAGGIDYASDGHGLVFLHANSGITFDLDAMRRANADSRLVRFRAIGANTAPLATNSIADIWVLVDGEPKFQRMQINGYSNVFRISIPLAEKDRFLTLAATDGGNGVSHDWIIFGDARLDLVKTVGSDAMPESLTIPNQSVEK